MRILGLIGNFLENTSEGQYEKENNQIIMEEMWSRKKEEAKKKYKKPF